MYSDLHAHILPGVDDGPKKIEDSIHMARVAAEQGTDVILATPHRKDVTENHSIPHIRDLTASLNLKLEELGIDLKVVLGMENHLDLELPAELAGGQALTMNDSRYALVEMPFHGHPNYLDDVLFKLQLQGLKPVLAHPERIEAVQRDPDLLARFVDRGMLTQVTAGSVVGHFGGKVKRLTLSLLRRGLVHVLASDTHFPDGPRSPKLGDGLEAAAAIVGQERARAMVVDTPRAVLADQTVEVEPPRKDEQPQRWWHIRRA